jgi:predicted nucleic acid-binding protein
MIAIDASAAYQLLFDEHADALIARHGGLTAPDFIVCELLNARWKAQRAAAPAPDLDFVIDFVGLIELEPNISHAAEAAELAERLDHPIYDCFYLAVARARRVKLLTSDERLTRKLRAHKMSGLLV